jgi:aarF domain-containing kinase
MSAAPLFAAIYPQAMSMAFGRPVDEVFSQLSSKPVAAASLGQVYKGRLKPEFGGREVAVKVQRPDVLEQVCLDLYLMRQAAEAISALPEVRKVGALESNGMKPLYKR